MFFSPLSTSPHSTSHVFCMCAFDNNGDYNNKTKSPVYCFFDIIYIYICVYNICEFLFFFYYLSITVFCLLLCYIDFCFKLFILNKLMTILFGYFYFLIQNNTAVNEIFYYKNLHIILS